MGSWLLHSGVLLELDQTFQSVSPNTQSLKASPLYLTEFSSVPAASNRGPTPIGLLFTVTQKGPQTQKFQDVPDIIKETASSLTLSAAVGSFTQTGNSAAFAVAHSIQAGFGAATLSGQAATFAVTVGGSPGSYQLTGEPASFEAHRILSAQNASVAFYGQPANGLTAVRTY